MAAGLTFGARFCSGAPGADAAAAGVSRASRPAGTPSGVDALVAANLDFAFRLQTAMLKGAAGQNLFISPLSVATALAMVFSGSAGSTQKAMATTLAYKSLSQRDVNAATLALLTGLQQRDKSIKLSIANSIWLRLGATVAPTFMATMHGSYGAALQTLDFTTPQAPATINAWVSKQTHGLIPSIVRSIDADTLMFLINALYFKGAWSSPFRQMSTQPAPFTTAAGKRATVPMMAQSGGFAYAKSASAEIIRLPYGAGGFAMYIVLPATGTSLPAFLGRLNPSAWHGLLSGLKPQHGSIQMPRLSVTFGAGLKPVLSAMGMGEAFDPNTATFPGILQKQNAYITDVQHKAVMHVDENGTEAAAVTSIGVGATAVIADMFHMVVDRPFMCAIRDETTGSLLFTGMIADPT
jgi:serpin B